MKKLLAASTVATMMLAFSAPPILAQSAGTAATTTASQDMRASNLIGQTVVGDHGGELCKIEDVFMKVGGEPTVIVSFADNGSSERKLVALPLSQVRLEGSKPRLTGVSEDSMRKMPRFVFPSGAG